MGTSAVAVVASALANLGGHARARTVKWQCAIVFAVSGVAGAAIGAQLGKRIDGQSLLAGTGGFSLFAALPAAVSVSAFARDGIEMTASVRNRADLDGAHVRAIVALSEELGLPEQEVREVYSKELDRLASQARIESFLGVLALSSTRSILRSGNKLTRQR